jgi:dihydrofolate reductase
MRRIVTFNHVTADGYFTSPDGKIDWVVSDDQADKAAAERLPGFDTVLFGRRTYEMFEAFWPKALEDPSGVRDPHGAGRRSPEIHAIAVWLNQAVKLVFSRTLKKVAWKNARVADRLEPRAIEDLKKQPGKDIMVFGSGSIVSQLTRHKLIDEYQFLVTPTILGSGRSLVAGVAAHIALRLLEATAHRSQNVMLRYSVDK